MSTPPRKILLVDDEAIPRMLFSTNHAKNLDPFGGAKPHLLSRGKEAPLKVNPEQAQAFRPRSHRVDLGRA